MTGFTVSEEDYLAHYGILRRSGRYPFGSGDTPEQKHRTFIGMIDDMRREGLTDTQIAKSFDISTTDFRALKSVARNELRAANIVMANRLKQKGMSNGAIAERMNLPGESSVRALLAEGAADRSTRLEVLTEMMRNDVDKKGILDVGIGTERHVAMSRTQVDTAISVLRNEGYVLNNIQVSQVGTSQKTLIKTLGVPGTTYGDALKRLEAGDIPTLGINKKPNGDFDDIKPPLSISSKRIEINYSKKNAKDEEIGGGIADGVIYVRPGKEDVSLGGSQYAQVRIAVDGTHYLKGMAVYKNDLPDGVDLVFNTNKSDTGNKLDALKQMKDEPGDPFGAITRQISGNDGKVKSVMNIVNEEGDWGSWSKNLASQMLSKQKPTLVKEQLDKTYQKKRDDLDEILALTNPSVKKKLLESYADGADSAAVHLRAAAMDRQKTQVIMPISSMKDTEVYAPQFKNGERVVLVRYPHGGTFEIPELTVNNKNKEAIDTLTSSARDAIGINHKVAERLSGADFDGDTVLVIPNNAGKVKSTPPLERLKGFDPKAEYPKYDGMKTMDRGVYNASTGKIDYGDRKPDTRVKQREMGEISNLITDMTIKGANPQEIARAVRHSMVVIDAEKHVLNYKQSFIDNNIPQLKERYQGGARKGTATLISRAKKDVNVNARKMSYDIDPKTGEKTYRETGETYTDRQGRLVVRQQRVPWASVTKNSRELSSGTKVEDLYASHMDRLKGLANEARREYASTQGSRKNPSASKIYAKEVSELNAALDLALRNAPLERQAQIIANAVVKQKTQSNPDMGKDEIRKLNGKALTIARKRVDAGKPKIELNDNHWEAIQAGAISPNQLDKILRNTDLDKIKEYATPRTPTVMTDAKQARARSLLNSGRTPAEVAVILGVSASTLQSSLKSE